MLGNENLPSGKLRGNQLIVLGVLIIQEPVKGFRNKLNPINGLMLTNLLQGLILRTDSFSSSQIPQMWERSHVERDHGSLVLRINE